MLLSFGVGIGAYLYRYLEQKYRFLLYYLMICLGTDVLSRIAGELFKNNLIFIIIFSMLELVFFYAFYMLCIFRKKKTIYTVLTLVAVAYMVYEMFAMQHVSPKEFQPYSKVICSFIIIGMSISCFFEKLAQEQQDQGVLKLNSVFIIYFSLNLIFFLPVNFLINVASTVKFYFWTANLILTTSFYIFICKEIWKNGSTRKPLPSGS